MHHGAAGAHGDGVVGQPQHPHLIEVLERQVGGGLAGQRAAQRHGEHHEPVPLGTARIELAPHDLGTPQVRVGEHAARQVHQVHHAHAPGQLEGLRPLHGAGDAHHRRGAHIRLGVHVQLVERLQLQVGGVVPGQHPAQVHGDHDPGRADQLVAVGVGVARGLLRQPPQIRAVQVRGGG